MQREDFGLYIHIPFCYSFCDYCDFFSAAAKKDDPRFDSFLKALVEDIKYQIEFFNVKEISTVYIGGGTPSVLGRRIKFLLDALKMLPGFSPVEFSIEANPESADEEFLYLCRQGGINRLSLGVQTFHEPSRAAVNRSSRMDCAAGGMDCGAILQERLSLASRFFPGSLSFDLITGLPFQNEEILLKDIERLLSFSPVHVSLYSLTIEKDTPLDEKIKNKTVVLPDAESADSLWLSGRDALINAGFCHYEASNFAREGKICLHNMRYWQMKNWLGAGPAASGTIINSPGFPAAKRYTYSNDIDSYIKKPSIHFAGSFAAGAVYEELDKLTLLQETLLMGFRCKEGPDPQLFKKRFGCEIEECIPKTLERWKDKNIMLFLNRFLSEALSELAKPSSLKQPDFIDRPKSEYSARGNQ